ncbi:MAG: glycosyltransferase [Anaerolineae bacterium]|nr:glycosyltransferase [Anaerolineae bacterium]
MPARDSLARVSVIIPTYNRSKLLRVALESVLAQTYPNVEIIVVDDGSTDDTATLMEEYAERVIYLRQANQDVAAARNTGIRAASGEYLTFLDDDDMILPTKVERQMQVLTSQSRVGLVHCRFYHIDEGGNRFSRIGPLPAGAVLKELLCRNFIWVGAPLIRRQCLERVGLFDEDIPAICADWDMWLRIAQAGYPFACVQEPLGAYRVQRGSMLANVAELEQAILAIFDKVFANPRLPADAAAVKAQACGTWRLWISWRYYAAHRWDDARRNLAEGLTLHPQLLGDRAEFLDTLCNEALDVRVDDPFQFIDGVLDHLPPAADAIRPYRTYLISRVYVGLALRHYGDGKIAEAKHQLTAAIALHPAMLERPEDFARALCAYAMRLPVTPDVYVAAVFRNLPSEARRLERLRSRVLSDVNIGCAFEDFFAGRRRLAARRILSGLRHRPSWLGNRGVVSVLMKSLPGFLSSGPAST